MHDFIDQVIDQNFSFYLWIVLMKFLIFKTILRKSLIDKKKKVEKWQLVLAYPSNFQSQFLNGFAPISETDKKDFKKADFKRKLPCLGLILITKK